MANISVSVDDTLKKQAEAICSELRVYPFYSKENQERLRKIISDYENGKPELISKSIEELKNMEE